MSVGFGKTGDHGWSWLELYPFRGGKISKMLGIWGVWDVKKYYEYR